MPPQVSLPTLLSQVRVCDLCAEHLPLGPRPVLQLAPEARVVIIGQAPGTKVHASGIPWEDASGDHLRQWLQLERRVFYDSARIAILPMGFCYPGKRVGGDAPPRKECAPKWHGVLLAQLPSDALLLLVGQYAHRYYLGKDRKKTLTETTRAFEEYLPRSFPLPHPSWRSKLWMTKNSWFGESALPRLRREVGGRLS